MTAPLPSLPALPSLPLSPARSGCSANLPNTATTTANTTANMPTVLLCAHCAAPIRATGDRFAPTYLHTETGRAGCDDGHLGTAEPAAVLTSTTLGSIA